MSNKKIGLYFEDSLPTTIPVGDDFSFIFLKKIKDVLDGSNNIQSIEYAELHLAKKNLDDTTSFVKLSKPNGFSINKLNTLLPNYNGELNLSLNDIVNYDNTSTKAIKIQDNLHGSTNTNFSYISNFSNTQLTNINTISNTILIGKNFGDSSIVINSNNNLFYGNNIGLKNNIINNNIIFSNDIAEIKTPTYQLNNNLFIGGQYVYDNHSSITNNIVENNIYIKNLGYGNIDDSFSFLTKIKLHSNTTYVTTPNDINSILVSDDNGVIQKISKTNFGLDTIVNYNANSLKRINIIDWYIGGFKNSSNTFSNLIISKNNFSASDFSTDSNLIYIGNPSDATNTGITNPIIGDNIIFANNGIVKGINNTYFGFNLPLWSDNSNYIGYNIAHINTLYNQKNNIIGNNVFQSSLSTINSISIGNNVGLDFNNSIDNINFGNNNLNNSGGLDLIIVGNDLSNYIVGDKNLFFGKGINRTSTINTSNNIIIGNYAESKLTNLFNNNLIINNYENITDTYEPLIKGKFSATNPELKINGKLKINPTHIVNSEFDITFTKILTISTDGEIGSENKSLSNIYSTTEVKTNDVWLGKSIYRRIFIVTFQNDSLHEQFSNLGPIETVCNISGTVKKSNGVVNNINKDGALSVSYYPDYNNDGINDSTLSIDYSTINNGNQITVIFEYTKTT